jgi:hypothetical protein
VLSNYEIACILCRLGYLHVFNPCKPEGSWEFDLSRREERICVKMLSILGMFEPGNNFLNEKFRWSRDVEALPGWELVRNMFLSQLIIIFLISIIIIDKFLANRRRFTEQG